MIEWMRIRNKKALRLESLAAAITFDGRPTRHCPDLCPAYDGGPPGDERGCIHGFVDLA